MAIRVLYVGRQSDAYSALWRHLILNNTEVLFAASQARALRELANNPIDLIVLDSASLPRQTQSLCRILRQKAPAARIVMLADKDVQPGLSYDVHLPVPVTWHRLLKAIEEVFRSDRRQVLAAGPFVLDLVEQTVIGPAGEARLTPKQFNLLALLVRNAGRPVSRQKIMEEIWHTSYMDDTRTLDVHISWLRGIIEPDPKSPTYLRTKRGLGYVFLPSGELAAMDRTPPPAVDGANHSSPPDKP